MHRNVIITYCCDLWISGREEGQLWYPRKVAVMRGTSRYVICDRGNERSRMQIFSKNGHFVKKIAIRYIDIVAGLAITPAGNSMHRYTCISDATQNSSVIES